ncbi:hypothetical protein [Curtobacterium sp. VKM Ac-2887]|uniref:hypothetical protein n=1 Tax=Curtobacterium sp. VKM Ac-2887 TaxID=2783819 RepID=UPI00188D3DAA|nr:hypothetical protein [Curtobacterium sp. VKM Ac-2887]MBF4585242.1 hypothetical protein [Curtobacterium sp. VKM Ac-2887]
MVNDELKRLKFYGDGDLANYAQFDRLDECLSTTARTEPKNIGDAIELHIVSRYVTSVIFPPDYSQKQKDEAANVVITAKAVLGRYFARIDDSTVGSILDSIPFGYQSDLFDLLARYRVFERVHAASMIKALTRAGLPLAAMTQSRALVEAYDEDIRKLLLEEPTGGELVVQKFLLADRRAEIFLPRSLQSTDMNRLLHAYIDHARANPNYLELIATAALDDSIGLDAKIKLKAQRQHALFVEGLFKEKGGTETGAGIRISREQVTPVITERDGFILNLTYSESWLKSTHDDPSILNNFQHLFNFADEQALLSLPSYESELSVIERLLTSGRRSYRTGMAFGEKNSISLLQVQLYTDYLASQGINLEETIAWFFRDYLREEFEAPDFDFEPSGPQSSYLEKTRHLFAEMEGIASQFRMYVLEGAIDRDLLALTSGPPAYESLPSLSKTKYLVASPADDINFVIQALFSDQSRLTYINETLNGRSAAQLLLGHRVSYSDFHHYQIPAIDRLIHLRILENAEGHIRLRSLAQLGLVHSLFTKENIVPAHVSLAEMEELRVMMDAGWLTNHSTLLTAAESSYFNFYLNKTQYSNGPELRNKYAHGTQMAPRGIDDHYAAYTSGLRLMMCLVIKINDDFVSMDNPG